jgi:hypothetical protein
VSRYCRAGGTESVKTYYVRSGMHGNSCRPMLKNGPDKEKSGGQANKCRFGGGDDSGGYGKCYNARRYQGIGSSRSPVTVPVYTTTIHY